MIKLKKVSSGVYRVGGMEIEVKREAGGRRWIYTIEGQESQFSYATRAEAADVGRKRFNAMMASRGVFA